MKQKDRRATAMVVLSAALALFFALFFSVTALAQEAELAGSMADPGKLADLGNRLPEIKKAVSDTGSGFLSLEICRQLKDWFLAILS